MTQVTFKLVILMEKYQKAKVCVQMLLLELIGK